MELLEIAGAWTNLRKYWIMKTTTQGMPVVCILSNTTEVIVIQQDSMQN